jgi:glycosyltransferase involved in cell wall biosynthesis
MVGDNLDEVNGIAINSRTLVRTLNKLGKKAYLIGIAHHTRQPRIEVKGKCILMMEGRCSIEQVSYEGSENAIPRLALLLRLLKRYPLDLVELETPGGVAFLTLIAANIIGIPVITHYRTDMLAYISLLVKNRLGAHTLKIWITAMTRFGGSVIVPSEAFKKKVNKMGVPMSRIHKLPRGVDLDMFHPNKSGNGAWQKWSANHPGIRLLYLGRISREKNLPFLVDAFPFLLKKSPAISLIVVGDGPYLKEMKARLQSTGKVIFTGYLRGQDLAGVLASADIMVFPSTTDTFGNCVVEALASGVPCIVSNRGGPNEIVEDGKSGLVFRADDRADLIDKISRLADNPAMIAQFKKAARERALQFNYPNSAEKFWDFFIRHIESFSDGNHSK